MQSKLTLTGFRLAATSVLLGLILGLTSHGGTATSAQNSTTPGRKDGPRLVKSYRIKKSHWYSPHLRGPQFFETEDGSGALFIHTEEAFKKYKKQLKRDGIRLKDARPYEDAHPICDKVQTGCRRWAPVAEVTTKFMIPAAMLGAGELAKTDVKVQQ